jgi:hypothetical protein
MRKKQNVDQIIEEAKERNFLENNPQYTEFKDLAAEVAQLPKEQQTKVALFAQGVIAATAAGVGNATE